jgi:CheY-like chemotaxis protein
MSPAPRRILVADDEPSIRDLLRTVLSLWGYGVRLCPDGAEALAAASEQGIDLLLVDFLMPEANGLDVLAQVRASGSRVPAILMSGHFPKDTARICRELGDVDMLEKPFSLADLKSAVASRLGPPKS